MKLIILGITLIIWNYTSCQDIVFPTDKETFQLSGSNPVITERIPITASQCPENMLLYPGDGSKSTWVCDCRPGYLYFPLNDSCYEAYRQGPCQPWNYVILPQNEAVPKCAANPCIKDGLVPYNDTCSPLRTKDGPCAPDGILAVNETTFQLECIPTNVVPFIIIRPPERCPAGSKRTSLGMCKRVL